MNTDTGLTKLAEPQKCTFGQDFPEFDQEMPGLNTSCEEMAEWAWNGYPICTKIHIKQMGDMNSDNANALAAVYPQTLEDCLFGQDLAEAVATNPETGLTLEVAYFCKRGPEWAYWTWMPKVEGDIDPKYAGSGGNYHEVRASILQTTGLDTDARIWTRPM
jgi:hypothetical protein